MRHNVEYTEISGVTKVELIAQMAKHDLLVDQAFSDYPLPVLAAEAMAHGLPALVSGYFAGAPSGYSQFNPPVLNCLPEDLEATLENLMTWNTGQWNELKASGYEFVSRNFRTQAAAKRLIHVILGQHQTAVSILGPCDIVYFDGLGAPKELISRLRLSRLARCFPGARKLS
jgi:glycosyltransferase involved in cell wall biosynthesis